MRALRGAALLAGMIAGVACARAGEPEILAALRSFFQTTDVEQRRELTARIAADPAYDRSRVGAWLAAAAPFEPLTEGQHALEVDLGAGLKRQVLLRVPAAYEPARPLPLVYALHGAGGSAHTAIGLLESLLGPHADGVLIAAPDQYVDWLIHAHWPPTREHELALTALRRRVNVDSSRVYLVGQSRGGHGAWTLGVLMSDQFAGIMPIAGALLLPEIEDLWPDFLPNLAQTRVICVWGAGDIYDGEGRPSPHGGIAQLNRALRRTAEELKLPIIAIEDAHADHGSARPTMQRVEELLSYRRVAYPPRVQHTFRDVSQARAYWLEGQEWTGPQWGGDPLRLEFRDGEDPFDPRVQQAARLRAYRRCLGELSGTVEENRIRISRSHLRDVIIWLGDGLIDWEKPVEVHSGGRRIFNGRIEPDLYVCLSEAALSYDFQRLRWGGVSYRAGGRPRVLNKELAQWRDDP